MARWRRRGRLAMAERYGTRNGGAVTAPDRYRALIAITAGSPLLAAGYAHAHTAPGPNLNGYCPFPSVQVR